MDQELLENICNMIKNDEDPYHVMDNLSEDLERISALPKTEYQDLYTWTGFFSLDTFLETFLGLGYSTEDIVEGIKIILFKMNDKRRIKSLLAEIKYCNEERDKWEMEAADLELEYEELVEN